MSSKWYRYGQEILVFTGRLCRLLDSVELFL